MNKETMSNSFKIKGKNENKKEMQENAKEKPT